MQIVSFCSTLLKPYGMYDKHTHAVSHSLTYLTLQSLLTLYLVSVSLKSIPEQSKLRTP